MAKGVDYAFSPHPPVSVLKSNGVVFACRYISAYAPNDKNGKNLLAAEKTSLLANGFRIVVVAEEGANRMMAGMAAGQADARHADAVVKGLGMPGIPVYFACDFDPTPIDQTAINAYLGGAADIIGLARTGIYGGFYAVKRALDGRHATFAWQTYAWSGGQWDARAQLRQVQNGAVLGGASVDWDSSMSADYGQWPRPSGHPVLSVGAAGSDVTELQTRLNVWGAKLAVDGSFGAVTRDAVMAFQRSHGIAVDGIAGPATWAALETIPPASAGYPAPAGLAAVRTRVDVSVTWSAVMAGGKPVTTYTVEARGNDGKLYASATPATNAAVLTGLRSGWQYEIRVWGNGGTAAPAHASVKITA